MQEVTWWLYSILLIFSSACINSAHISHCKCVAANLIVSLFEAYQKPCFPNMCSIICWVSRSDNFRFVCGFCNAAVIGLLYPYLDDVLGETHCHKQEWSSVMRCIAVFVGINHASAVSFYCAYVHNEEMSLLQLCICMFGASWKVCCYDRPWANI